MNNKLRWVEIGDDNWFGYIRGMLMFRVSWQSERNKWRMYRFDERDRVDSVKWLDSWKPEAVFYDEIDD